MTDYIIKLSTEQLSGSITYVNSPDPPSSPTLEVEDFCRIRLKLLRNGVAVPGAEATVTGATGDTYNISFATLLRVLPSCCVINNNLELQVQATAAGTISNASLSVVKMA